MTHSCYETRNMPHNMRFPTLNKWPLISSISILWGWVGPINTLSCVCTKKKKKKSKLHRARNIQGKATQLKEKKQKAWSNIFIKQLFGGGSVGDQPKRFCFYLIRTIQNTF